MGSIPERDWWENVPREQWHAAIDAQMPRLSAVRVTVADTIDAINGYRMATWGTGIKRQQRRKL